MASLRRATGSSRRPFPVVRARQTPSPFCSPDRQHCPHGLFLQSPFSTEGRGKGGVISLVSRKVRASSIGRAAPAFCSGNSSCRTDFKPLPLPPLPPAVLRLAQALGSQTLSGISSLPPEPRKLLSGSRQLWLCLSSEQTCWTHRPGPPIQVPLDFRVHRFCSSLCTSLPACMELHPCLFASVVVLVLNPNPESGSKERPPKHLRCECWTSPGDGTGPWPHSVSMAKRPIPHMPPNSNSACSQDPNPGLLPES